MDKIFNDILTLLASELDYKDILELEVSEEYPSLKLCKETCNRLWIEKSIRDYGVTKDDIIGDPLSFYFGCKKDKGHNWDFTDPHRYDVIKVSYIRDEDVENEENISFYIPGIEIPKNEKVFVGYLSIKNMDGGGFIFTTVSKSKERTYHKLIEEIKKEIRQDLIYEKFLNIPLNVQMRKKVNISFSSDDALTPHNIVFLIFETAL